MPRPVVAAARHTFTAPLPAALAPRVCRSSLKRSPPEAPSNAEVVMSHLAAEAKASAARQRYHPRLPVCTPAPMPGAQRTAVGLVEAGWTRRRFTHRRTAPAWRVSFMSRIRTSRFHASGVPKTRLCPSRPASRSAVWKFPRHRRSGTPWKPNSRSSIRQTSTKIPAPMLRGGAFKPRSSPYSFQGLSKKGLELLRARKRAQDPALIVVTEASG